MGLIILTIVFAFIIPAFFIPLFILVHKKDKRRNRDGSFVVGTYGQAKEVPALIVFGVLCYIGLALCGSLCYVFDKLLYGYIFVPIISVFCYIVFQSAIATRYAYLVFHDDCITEARIFLRDIEIPYSAMQYYYIGMRLPRGFCICDKRGKCLTSILAANAPIRTKLIQILEEKAVLPISPDELNRLIKANTNKVLRSRNNTIAMSIISAFFVAVALVILFLPTSRDSYYDVSGTVESFKTVNNTGSLYEFTLEDDDSRYELDKYAILYFDGDPETVLSKGSEVKLKIIRSYVDGRRFVSYIECDGKVYLSTADYEDALNEYYDILSYIFFAISGICIGVSIYFFVSYAKSKRKR